MKVFESVRDINPGRSVFDLSYEKKFTCDMGELIPVLCEEMVPGDVFEIGNQAMVRFQPLVAPILHEINMYVHYYFVPYRLLWDDWEDFITGGRDGNNASVLPRWTPSNTNVGSLWDYMGLPTTIVPSSDCTPLDFIRSAYNFIYNEYYRDQNLIDEIALTSEVIQKRSWEKDYFTSALPWQQRGTAPALPISGTVSAVFNGADSYFDTTFGSRASRNVEAYNTATQPDIKLDDGSSITINDHLQLKANSAFKTWLGNNSINLSSASTFNVSDLRLAFQIQKWMERNARAGARYTEFLKAHFGVAPRDDRLDRPEYFGGTKSPVIVSEVLKTAQDGSVPLGSMAGHGLSVSNGFAGKYHAVEFGLVMGIMSIMPKSAYQQGINRQWLRRTRFDFYHPEFANLSEQAIERVEIYANTVSGDNRTIFGYQGRYDEMRVKGSMVCGDMRSTFNYWHLGRVFGSAPLLNQSFIECVPDKRVFAVQNQDELIVSFGNRIRALRPLPLIAEPGMIDHA